MVDLAVKACTHFKNGKVAVTWRFNLDALQVVLRGSITNPMPHTLIDAQANFLAVELGCQSAVSV